MTDFQIHPLTPDRWDDFEDLFGCEKGANGGCWCQWHRLPRREFRALDRGGRKEAMEACVRRGPPPGLLAYAGDLTVAWVALAPRAHVLVFDRGKVSAPTEDGLSSGALAITCFYVRPGWRKKGLTRLLAQAAIAEARAAGAPAVEVAAIDPDKKLTSGEGFVGLASVFRALGFEEVARRSPRRPLMRLSLLDESRTGSGF